MIKESKPLSMVEATEYMDKAINVDTLIFVKKFAKLNPKDAEELREKIEKLNILSIDSGHISKIIDLVPETQEDLNKILIDTNVEEDIGKKILEIVKEFI